MSARAPLHDEGQAGTTTPMSRCDCRRSCLSLSEAGFANGRWAQRAGLIARQMQLAVARHGTVARDSPKQAMPLPNIIS